MSVLKEYNYRIINILFKDLNEVNLKIFKSNFTRIN